MSQPFTALQDGTSRQLLFKLLLLATSGQVRIQSHKKLKTIFIVCMYLYMYSKEIGFIVFSVVTLQTVFWFVTLCSTSFSEEHIPPVMVLKRTIFLIYYVHSSYWPGLGFVYSSPLLVTTFFATCMHNLLHSSRIE